LSCNTKIRDKRLELLEKKKNAKTKAELDAIEALESEWKKRKKKISKLNSIAGKKAAGIPKTKKVVEEVVEVREEVIEEKVEEKIEEETPQELKALPVAVDEIDKKTQDEIEEAIKLTGGWLSKTAKELGMPVEKVKSAIKRNKRLKDVLFETKEHLLDLVEDTLFERIMEKKDVLGAMFWLKCQGQHRGWIDKPKAGSSADKPIHIKITPVGIAEGERRVGRPKKIYTEVKVLPGQQSKDDILESRLANKDDVIEGEILDI
jgi:hypothetical protein